MSIEKDERQKRWGERRDSKPIPVSPPRVPSASTLPRGPAPSDPLSPRSTRSRSTQEFGGGAQLSSTLGAAPKANGRTAATFRDASQQSCEKNTRDIHQNMLFKV